MPEIVVLDTHIWIWYINRELEKFPYSWLEIIDGYFRQYSELNSLLMI